jgi:hypothetical protein
LLAKPVRGTEHRRHRSEPDLRVARADRTLAAMTLISTPSLRRWLAAALFFATASGALAACATVSLVDYPAEQVFRARCAECHALKDPAEYTPSELRAAVATYGPDAGIHSAAEQKHLADWLVTQTAMRD